MDRNSIIGLVLIGLIMIVWFQLISPSKPQPRPEDKGRTTAPIKTPIDLATQDSIAKIAVDTAAAVDDLSRGRFGEFAAAATGTEKLIAVETEEFKAVFSSKGATLKSFVQKKYLSYDKKPFDLITAKQGAISLFLATREGRTITTTDLYFTPKLEPEGQEKYVLRGQQELRLPFELALADGKKMSITYTLKGQGYNIGMTTEFAGLGNDVPTGEYQVEWNGGLTYSELNRVDEATFSSAHVFIGGGLEKIDADKINEPRKTQPTGDARWVAVQSKYFAAAIIAKDKTEGAYIEGSRSTDDPNAVFETYKTALKVKLASGQATTKQDFSLFIGPLDYQVVKSNGVGLERIMDFGWEWLTRPFAEWLIVPTFNILGKYISNYGLIIIIFALLIKLITYPFTAASTKSMKKMAAVQPQMQALQEQYKTDPARLQSETAKLYKEAGVNPLGGCLPTLLQMPILIAMFNVFRGSIELRQQPFLWSSDLSVPDAIFTFPFSIPLYGNHIAIYPILMAVAVVVQQKVTPVTAQQNDQAKAMQYIFPVMMLVLFNSTPAGLGLYYFIFNILGILQQVYINQTTPAATVPVVVQPVKALKPKKKSASAV
ncbi:MAG: membrane protein insertase YidC [Rhizobacter sp.]|nr:membrane protein insertase YidC [Chlorobiales bacterium]